MYNYRIYGLFYYLFYQCFSFQGQFINIVIQKINQFVILDVLKGNALICGMLLIVGSVFGAFISMGVRSAMG